MSNAIEVGDLVITLSAANEEYLPHIGKPFIVLCRSNAGPRHWLLSPECLAADGRSMGWHERRLKKIDPPAQQSERETEKELTA